MQILKIQPSTTSDLDQSISQTTNNSINQESIPTSPGSITENERTSQISNKGTVPLTPNSNSHHRQNYGSTVHQNSLNSSGVSSANRSSIESPTSRKSFMKQTISDSNLASSPISMKYKTNSKSNTSLTTSGVLVTDYRQSVMMKRIVNP